MLHLDGGETVTAKCLLIATGADYRLLGVEGCERFEGCGVYYAATPNEAQMCRGSDVVVVGGGNSAGQAAVFLAAQARKVYLVVRGDDLYKDMSSYLARRIEETPNIEVLLNTEVRRMSGDGHLSEVELVNNKTGEARDAWKLRRCSASSARCRAPTGCRRRSRGTPRAFVRTGAALAQSPHWTCPAAAVPAGDQPPRRVRRRRRALRLDQARRLGGRRGRDGGPVRPRVLEGNVSKGTTTWRQSARDGPTFSARTNA